MPDSPHLLIPWATAQAEGCQQALNTLSLPQLDRLLARLAPAGGEAGDEHDYAPPHERALARALGLPAHATPWAAWEAADSAQPCAWITPCHWKAGADQIHMLPPEALALAEAESRALLALLAPWFAEDGITLHYQQPLRWLARGRAFENLETAALDRVQGCAVPLQEGALAAQRQLHGHAALRLRGKLCHGATVQRLPGGRPGRPVHAQRGVAQRLVHLRER